MAESEVKGSVFYSTFLSIEQVFGAQVAQGILTHLQGVVGERLRLRSIVDSAWYPIGWVSEIDARIEEALHRVDANPLYRLATAGVRRDLKGMYRIFVKMLTPQMVISSAPRLFKQYYRGGEVQVVRSEPGLALVEFTQWAGFTANTWTRCLGGCEAAVVACGATGVHGRWLTGGLHENAKLEITWTDTRS